jgi:flagellar hook-length control protein FliK
VSGATVGARGITHATQAAPERARFEPSRDGGGRGGGAFTTLLGTLGHTDTPEPRVVERQGTRPAPPTRRALLAAPTDGAATPLPITTGGANVAATLLARGDAAASGALAPAGANAPALAPAQDTVEAAKAAAQLGRGDAVVAMADERSGVRLPPSPGVNAQPAQDLLAQAVVLRTETHLAGGAAALAPQLATAIVAAWGEGEAERLTAAAPQAKTAAARTAVAPTRTTQAELERSVVAPARFDAAWSVAHGTGRRNESSEETPRRASPTPGAGAQEAALPTPEAAAVLFDAPATAPQAVARAVLQALDPPLLPQPSPPLATTLKVLTIQLEPAELGTVTARLELRDATLELNLEASRRETAELLKGSGTALGQLLRVAGYALEGVRVSIADAGAGATAQGPQAGPPGQSSSGSPDGGTQSAPGGRGERGAAPRSAERQGSGDENPGLRHRGGGLYV